MKNLEKKLAAALQQIEALKLGDGTPSTAGTRGTPSSAAKLSTPSPATSKATATPPSAVAKAKAKACFNMSHTCTCLGVYKSCYMSACMRAHSNVQECQSHTDLLLV